VHRTDDSADVFRDRLEVYRRQTAPLIEYYADRGVFREVDGELTIDEIYGLVSGIVRGQLQGVTAV
jgi:adenylate kinase